jgi:hypothetical protein
MKIHTPSARKRALGVKARGPRYLAMVCSELRSDTGSALVELAVFLSLLGVPLLLSASYFGTEVIDRIDVDNAAYAGAMYAMTSSTFAEDTSNIQTAAQEDSSRFGSNLVVTPTIFYACSTALSGTQYSTQSAATTACTGSLNHPLEMVQVIAKATVTPPLTVPGLPKTVTITSTVIMEVEE